MNTAELLAVIKGRRSIRRFDQKRPVTDEQINSILEAAIWAPTGSNEQELRFVVIREQSLIEEFRKFKPMANPAALILVLIDFASYYASAGSRVKRHPHKRHLPYIDTGLAMMNMLLMAYSLGLASLPLNVSTHLVGTSVPAHSFFQRILRAIAIRCRLSLFGVTFFGHFLGRLGIDARRYIPAACVALGYGNESVDLSSRLYRGRPVQRQPLEKYILGRF
ncbi:MAG: nitroreductase family protein [Kiritimatiellae bacterium]|nr:nitroreductase family protein [Kiritimatiellia bacterium]